MSEYHLSRQRAVSAMLSFLEFTAVKAGKAILAVGASSMHVNLKCDQSPVTIADQTAERIIIDELHREFPGIPVVAEEAAGAGDAIDIGGSVFFLVDPLDGTKEFISRSDDYTVNIALVENGVPIIGVVYAPARRTGYCASGGRAQKFGMTVDQSIGCRTEIRCRPRSANLTAVASRSHINKATELFLRQNRVFDFLAVGSSLKFCLVAEGSADVYPRYGRTMEWDTAAGDAILRAAGGTTALVDGGPLKYGKTKQLSDCDFANPHFIAWGACH